MEANGGKMEANGRQMEAKWSVHGLCKVGSSAVQILELSPFASLAVDVLPFRDVINREDHPPPTGGGDEFCHLNHRRDATSLSIHYKEKNLRVFLGHLV